MITIEQLRSIEFVSHSDGSRWCPACSYERCNGHAPDCWLDAAIIDSAVSGHADTPVPAAPPDLVELVRRVIAAHTKETVTRAAWAETEPWSPESGQMFAAVLAREAETREAFSALAAYPLPPKENTNG